ncbi:MAG: gephyrin-like molybdotransferase Glp, partial [Planctomycetota bacterium]
MLSPQEALKIVLAHVEPIGTERVPIETALRRCLAEDVLADRDLPAMDRSAMDGYAIRARDINRLPCRLTLVGEVAAGSPGRPQVRPSSCVIHVDVPVVSLVLGDAVVRLVPVHPELDFPGELQVLGPG